MNENEYMIVKDNLGNYTIVFGGSLLNAVDAVNIVKDVKNRYPELSDVEFNYEPSNLVDMSDKEIVVGATKRRLGKNEFIFVKGEEDSYYLVVDDKDVDINDIETQLQYLHPKIKINNNYKKISSKDIDLSKHEIIDSGFANGIRPVYDSRHNSTSEPEPTPFPQQDVDALESQQTVEYQDIVLKSPHPEIYPDRIVRCRVIENDNINDYLNGIPDSEKIVGTKTAPVEARKGIPGETIKTTLKTTYEGLEYILSEVDNMVGETEMEDGTMQPDIVVTNVNSTSNEEYIVRANKFPNMYEANADGTFIPVPETRELARLSEDVVIITSWGEPAVGLKGSYIVIYDASKNDFNTIEKGALESTYDIQKAKGIQI